MKKLLVVLFALLLLTACASKKEEPAVQEEPVVEPSEEPVGEVAGGWSINLDLPDINDAYFAKATSEYVGMDLRPLFVLGSQPTGYENFAYLSYGTTVTAEPKTEFKVVIVSTGENSEETQILNVADFNLEDYLSSDGSTTPDGLMGGWKDNTELPNMLDDEVNAIFEKAFEGFAGVGYTPVAVLGTQVVAGTNYAILALGTSVTAEPITHLYIVNIYADLNGNASINNICGIDLSTFNK